MKFLERLAITLGLVVVGVTAVYRHVLSDDQKDALREASDAIRSATREVTDMVSPLISSSPTKTEEEAMSEANRAHTAAQWEALGY